MSEAGRPICGVRLDDADTALNGFGGALGRERILRAQKRAQPHLTERGRGEPYLWHSGASISCSVPHVSSHAFTSSALACNPVC